LKDLKHLATLNSFTSRQRRDNTYSIFFYEEENSSTNKTLSIARFKLIDKIIFG